eukprot:TRINITY_DN89_c0_g3_i1.p1 TRINITY_DN89_c0_g3~~TRINITY_DN89_c0_g3_i1.p1  ORF type:complete len:168 (-),score=17.62 TRINITY_DN89_c0_g3_i1:291-794(-)
MQTLWNTLLCGKFEIIESKDTSVSVIKLPTGVHWLTEKSPFLFVRQCDRDLYDIVRKLADDKSSGKGVIITGNPGIGKSWFLSYCLFRLAQEQKKKTTVFFESVSRNEAWLFNPDGTVQFFPKPLDSYPPIIRNDPTGSREPREVDAFTVVTAFQTTYTTISLTNAW